MVFANTLWCLKACNLLEEVVNLEIFQDVGNTHDPHWHIHDMYQGYGYQRSAAQMVYQVDCISPQRSKWWSILCHVIISIIHNTHVLCIPIFYTANHKSHSPSPPRLKTRPYHMREHKYTSYNSTSTCTVIIPHTHHTIALYVRSTIPSNMPPVAISVDVDVGRDSRD